MSATLRSSCPVSLWLLSFRPSSQLRTVDRSSLLPAPRHRDGRLCLSFHHRDRLRIPPILPYRHKRLRRSPHFQGPFSYIKERHGNTCRRASPLTRSFHRIPKGCGEVQETPLRIHPRVCLSFYPWAPYLKGGREENETYHYPEEQSQEQEYYRSQYPVSLNVLMLGIVCPLLQLAEAS